MTAARAATAGASIGNAFCWNAKVEKAAANRIVRNLGHFKKVLRRRCDDPAEQPDIVQARIGFHWCLNLSLLAIEVIWYYGTKETNLTNLEAADTQYARSIRPRLRRRDATMNEYLVPLFDTTGRLYLQTDDPAGESRDYVLRRDRRDIETGIRTINEVRADRGLDPASWCHEPWLPLQHAPPSFNRRQETTYAPQTGRNKPEKLADESGV